MVTFLTYAGESGTTLKVSFDIKNLIFGNCPNAKEGFDPNKMINSGGSIIEYQILNYKCPIVNLTFKIVH